MFELIISAIIIWGVFRILDAWFNHRRNKSVVIREGDHIKEINGQYYLVRDQIEKLEKHLDETEAAPHRRRPNLKVVK